MLAAMIEAPKDIDISALPLDLQTVALESGRNDNRAAELVADLSLDQLNWRPRNHRGWSVGQCIEHIAATTNAYLHALEDALKPAKPEPFQPFVLGWMSAWFLARTEPPPSIKIKAPEMVQPSGFVKPNVLEDLWESNHWLRQLALKATAFDLNRVRFRNPFAWNLKLFTVAAGFQIINAHARRHLWQAGQVRQDKQFPR